MSGIDDVISEEENELIFSIRKRRNTLVHELLKEIGNGLDEQDIQMIVKLLKLQQHINAWRVKQINMPIMEIKRTVQFLLRYRQRIRCRCICRQRIFIFSSHEATAGNPPAR